MRIVITLNEEEMEALRTLAASETRTIKEQIVHILRLHLFGRIGVAFSFSGEQDEDISPA